MTRMTSTGRSAPHSPGTGPHPEAGRGAGAGCRRPHRHVCRGALGRLARTRAAGPALRHGRAERHQVHDQVPRRAEAHDRGDERGRPGCRVETLGAAKVLDHDAKLLDHETRIKRLEEHTKAQKPATPAQAPAQPKPKAYRSMQFVSNKIQEKPAEDPDAHVLAPGPRSSRLRWNRR